MVIGRTEVSSAYNGGGAPHPPFLAVQSDGCRWLRCCRAHIWCGTITASGTTDWRCRAPSGVQVSGNNSVVECDLAKVEVAGSNPVSRSNIETSRPLAAPARAVPLALHSARSVNVAAGPPARRFLPSELRFARSGQVNVSTCELRSARSAQTPHLSLPSFALLVRHRPSLRSSSVPSERRFVRSIQGQHSVARSALNVRPCGLVLFVWRLVARR
jgi:hypothetical protein